MDGGEDATGKTTSSRAGAASSAASVWAGSQCAVELPAAAAAAAVASEGAAVHRSDESRFRAYKSGGGADVHIRHHLYSVGQSVHAAGDFSPSYQSMSMQRNLAMVLTPRGVGAIGVIRLRGEGVDGFLDKHF